MTKLLAVLAAILALGLCWKAAITYIKVMGKHYRDEYYSIRRE